jgi:hypothetical protein
VVRVHAARFFFVPEINMVTTMQKCITQAGGRNWHLYNGDCVEGVKALPDNSIDYSIFSPPFANLFTYSASDRDMGNCQNETEFYEHFKYLIPELYRILKPGRNLSFHCCNIPTTKGKHGYIGQIDFRGILIRLFVGDDAADFYTCINAMSRRQYEAAQDNDDRRVNALQDIITGMQAELAAHPSTSGFIYHSEVTIWKDPVMSQQRTNALGLLHKQIVKDSARCRSGIADFLVTMQKPGVNPEPVAGCFKDYYGEDQFTAPYTHDTDTRNPYSIEVWQRVASPVWLDIRINDTLGGVKAKKMAKGHDEEPHVCPLQKTVIQRGLQLYTNPGDVVLSPFAGIGSEGYVSLEMGRKFVGFELKQSYYQQAVDNLKVAGKDEVEQLSLLELVA